MDQNTLAFLAAVRHAEGTDKVADPYRVVFGYTVTLTDLSDHPLLTGEWLGAHYTNKAGQTIFTTAAGAYQIIRPVWVNLKQQLNLPDFTQPSQDAGAIELIREAGALDAIQAGDLATAVSRCHDLWASLPSSTAGQPTVSMNTFTTAYQAAGGALA
jgi:lysozyme